MRIKLSDIDWSAFRAGISARAEVYSDVNSSLRPGVPVQSVQYAELGRKGEAPLASVFVLKDGVAKRRQVQTGAADDSHIRIGFVFQSFHLLPRMSALANVALPLIYRGVAPAKRREASLAALTRVGLELARQPQAKQTAQGGGGVSVWRSRAP